MIPLEQISYVRLGTRSLDSTLDYARTILGLELVDRAGRSAYLRSDNRHHTLCFVEGHPEEEAVGFELRHDAELTAIAAHLDDAGYPVREGNAGECDARHVSRFIAFRDPTGNAIELSIRPHESARRYFASRDAGISGFSHIGLRTTDAKRDEAFWTQIVGARVSDWIGDAALLRINPVHHTIALFPSTFGGVQHINHQVESIDDVMRSYYLLRERGVRIVFGPGRHPSSGAVFLYFEGPDGMTYEYSWNVRMIEDEEGYRPRQFPFADASFCLWGAKPDIPEFRSDSSP